MFTGNGNANGNYRNPDTVLSNTIIIEKRSSPTTERHGVDYTKFDDQTLMRLIAHSQEDAPGELYDRYHRLVLILVLGASNLFLWGRLSGLEKTGQAGLITIHLQGTEAATSATGMLVISQDGEYGTLVVDGLPLLDESQQYQLWLIQDGQRTSGGVFSVSEEGYGTLMIASPEPLISYSQFGITIESSGGSLGPTGDKVLGGQF